jgi:hypothetical protein
VPKHPLTIKLFEALLTACSLIALPAYLGPAWLEPIGSAVVLAAYLSIHLFSHLGVPGLLEQGGHCGWGWCAPTFFGWFFMVALWLAVFWIAAWAIAWLLDRRR